MAPLFLCLIFDVWLRRAQCLRLSWTTQADAWLSFIVQAYQRSLKPPAVAVYGVKPRCWQTPDAP